MRTIEEIQNSQLAIDRSFKVGDYVFATKYQDAYPRDRWRVDIVSKIVHDAPKSSIYFSETGVIPFNYAQKISKEEGEMILEAWESVYP